MERTNLMQRMLGDRRARNEMANVCGKCKTWRKEQYWNALHNKYHFCKIMLGDFETELRVPRKFKKEFKGELLEEVKLRGPSGNIWTTKVVKREQDHVFRHGWEIFAKDHGLVTADFLVFHYSGNSSFDVLIFDSTGCEREETYFVVRDYNSSNSTRHCCSLRETIDPQTNASEGQIHDVQAAYVLGSSSSNEGNDTENHVSAEKFPASVKRNRRKNQNMQRKKGTDAGDISRAAGARQTGETKKQENEKRDSGEKIGLPEIVQCSDESSVKMEDDQEDQGPFTGADSDAKDWSNKGNRIRHLISSRREISRQEKLDVLKRAKDMVKPPSCHIVMKPSHVSHGFTLTILKWFAEYYLPKESQAIELRVPPGNKTWEVQFKRWKQQCTLNRGWAEFVLDNNLEVSDVCVLAPAYAKKGEKSTGLRVKRKKSTLLSVDEEMTVLNVSIFRVVEDIVELKVF